MYDDIKLKTGLGRRDLLKTAGAGALVFIASGMLPKDALATPQTADALLKKLTGGGAAKSGRITLKLPEIAENGNTVPITVSVDSPMTEKDYVKSIHVVAEGNPNPEVVSMHFSPASGKAEVATRMRLGKSQKVTAAAVMSDGSVYMTKKNIKVTIGGCGG